MKPIETARLVLRDCEAADASALSRLMVPDISDWVASWPPNLSQEKATQMLRGFQAEDKAGRGRSCVVMRKDANDVIGWMRIGLDPRPSKSAELSYWIGRDYHRKGYAFEMADAAIRACFSDLRVEKVLAGAQQTNSASLALFAKLGLSYHETKSVFAPARNRNELCDFWVIHSADQDRPFTPD